MLYVQRLRCDLELLYMQFVNLRSVTTSCQEEYNLFTSAVCYSNHTSGERVTTLAAITPASYRLMPWRLFTWEFPRHTLF